MCNYSPLPNIQQIPWPFAVAIWTISRLWPLFCILWEHGLPVSLYDIPQCGYTRLKHSEALEVSLNKGRSYIQCELTEGARSEFITAVFSYITTCQPLNSNPCFGRACCLLSQVPKSPRTLNFSDVKDWGSRLLRNVGNSIDKAL
jgi:hypothetical protein